MFFWKGTMLPNLSYLPTLPSLLARPQIPLIDRDLSWLQFNERVLNEARDPSNPPLERVKFLAICSANLDEFFMIRFAALQRSITRAQAEDQKAEAKGDVTLAERKREIRNNILETVAEFIGRQADTFETLASELEARGIYLVRNAKEDDAAYEVAKRIFDEQILPNLLPPEPYAASQLAMLDNLQSAIIFREDRWVRIPKTLAPVYVSAVSGAPGGAGPLGAGSTASAGPVYCFFLDDLLLTFLKGPTLDPIGVLRLTRDGDFSVDLDIEDPENIPDIVRSGLGKRDRGRPVRLQIQGAFRDAFLGQCLAALKLQQGQLIPSPGSLYFAGLWALVNQSPEMDGAGKAPLKYQPLDSRLPRVFSERGKLFDRLRGEDILLHHPYDSFDAYVAFIQTACADPEVVSIEQTVYRMDVISPVIQAMKEAAKTKKVRVTIELRARFDELNNLRLADELKKAGVEVGFGFGKLKLHAKIALITREERNAEGGTRTVRYTHLSTGNYNSATARVYTDLALLTSSVEIGQDARIFFDAVMNEQVPSGFKTLLPAPTRMHRKLLGLIDAEALAARGGEKARIVAKMNALVDEEVIGKLYEASRAGVQIDLIVRGACSLIPGIEGLSENIRVISLVDRFLEHSRIYFFGHSRAMYLSSADWMPRNFFSRLELAFPVTDPLLFRYIEETLIPLYLCDHVKARELTNLGTWKKRAASEARKRVSGSLKALLKGETLRAQLLFERLVQREYQGTPLWERGRAEAGENPKEPAKA